MVGFAPALVEGVPRQPLPFGLFSVLTPRPEGDSRWETGIEWETLTCEPASGRAGAGCAPTELDPTIGLPKDLARNGGTTGEAAAFAVYGHHTCSPIGRGPEVAQEFATAHLMAREEARVEQALWTGDLGNTPNMFGATVLGTGLNRAEAVARLEDWIAENYGSLGVLHGTRGAATILSEDGGLARVNGQRLVSTLGTPIVAGAGYPNTSPAGAVAAAGTYWLYVTPAIFGYRSDVFTSSAVPGDLLDRASNDLYAIAERVYTLGWDPCGVAAAQFTVGA